MSEKEIMKSPNLPEQGILIPHHGLASSEPSLAAGGGTRGS